MSWWWLAQNEQWKNRRWLEGMQRRMAGCLEVSARQNKLRVIRSIFFSQASASFHIFSLLWWQGTSQKKFRTNVTNALWLSLISITIYRGLRGSKKRVFRWCHFRAETVNQILPSYKTSHHLQYIWEGKCVFLALLLSVFRSVYETRQFCT